MDGNTTRILCYAVSALTMVVLCVFWVYAAVSGLPTGHIFKAGLFVGMTTIVVVRYVVRD